MAASIRAALKALDRHVHLLDLDRDRLGERAMDLAVTVILRDMAAEVDPDGSTWPELSEAYAEAKARIAPGEPMAVLHGHMKTREQLRGEDRITPGRAVMVYGTDDAARDEARWFQEGDGDRRPPRPFWGFSDENLTRQAQLFREHAKAHLKRP